MVDNFTKNELLKDLDFGLNTTWQSVLLPLLVFLQKIAHSTQYYKIKCYLKIHYLNNFIKFKQKIQWYKNNKFIKDKLLQKSLE